MTLIIGLPVAGMYTFEKLNSMSDREKYLYGMTRPDAQCFESTAEFLEMINEGDVCVNDLAWFEIEIE